MKRLSDVLCCVLGALWDGSSHTPPSLHAKGSSGVCGGRAGEKSGFDFDSRTISTVDGVRVTAPSGMRL